jgi:hypothetical protein
VLTISVVSIPCRQAGDTEVRMAELALDHGQRHAFASHLSTAWEWRS